MLEQGAQSLTPTEALQIHDEVERFFAYAMVMLGYEVYIELQQIRLKKKLPLFNTARTKPDCIVFHSSDDEASYVIAEVTKGTCDHTRKKGQKAVMKAAGHGFNYFQFEGHVVEELYQAVVHNDDNAVKVWLALYTDGILPFNGIRNSDNYDTLT